LLDLWRDIKDRINLAEYAQSRVDTERRGGVLFCSSPINADEDPSCALYTDHFHDFSSGQHGDVFDFIQLIDGVGLPEALAIAADVAGVKLDDESMERANRIQNERTELKRKFDFSVEMRCDIFWEWLHGRGLSDNTIETFCLGYLPSENAITIPIYDAYGGLASISLRRIKGEPRYQHFNTSFFIRNRHLYNMHLAVDGIAEGKPLYLVEGQFDVMALWEAGITTGVCTYGESLSVGQASLIDEKFGSPTVVMLPDQDTSNKEEHLSKLRRNVHTIRGAVKSIDLRISVLSSKDANDVLLDGGADVLVSEACNHVGIDRFLLDVSLDGSQSVEAEYEAARRIVSPINNQLVVDDLCKYLSERWGKDKQVVYQFLCGPKDSEKVGIIKRASQAIEAYEEFADSLANPVFRFPWPTFNDKIRAIAPGHVFAFIARTSVGKTMWLLNLIDHCCRTSPDTHVMLFSLEQPTVEIASRLLAISSASMGNIDNCISTSEIELICRAREDGEEWGWHKDEFVNRYNNLSIIDQPLDVSGIEATINEGSMAYGPVKIVFLDYLGLIEGKGDEYERISRLAYDLKHVAKRTRTVFLYLHQLSRKGEDGTKPVTLDQARGSGVIEESVDYLIGAWRPGGTDSPEFAAAIIKNRHGAVGDTMLYFDSRTLSITEVENPPPDVVYGEDSGEEAVSEPLQLGMMDDDGDPFDTQNDQWEA